MAKPSKAVMAFMEKYGVASDEVWPVPGGKAYAVKHKALERIAIKQGIVFEPPQLKVCDLERGLVVILISGKMGDKVIHSFGEATPKNCKNAYMVAMAEKRGIDRVILKLLAVHGDLYSEEEADDFKRQNPHVTRPTDILPAADYDESGEVIDNIPHAPATKKLRVMDMRPAFERLQQEAHSFGDSKPFIAWMNRDDIIAQVANWKLDWQQMFRGLCKEHLEALRTQERGDDMRIAG